MPQRPYKSTTHKETYCHLRLKNHPELQAITVFMRQENDGIWYCTPALCVKHDQFDRRIGRQVARRRYFRWVEDRTPLGPERPKIEIIASLFMDPAFPEEREVLH